MFGAREFGHPAVVLPLTTLQAPDVYRDTGWRKDFDIFFSCMFTDDHIRRKNVDLLFAVLDRLPGLRVAWVGGHDAYEPWLIEDGYNRHFETWGRDGLPGAAPWSEDESSMCWHLGGGVFAAEQKKQEKLRSLIEETRHRGYRIQFYANLGRAHIVYVLNRCRAAATLSSSDLWPRSITEALACGTPAVALDALLCGLEAIEPATGVVVPRNRRLSLRDLGEPGGWTAEQFAASTSAGLGWRTGVEARRGSRHTPPWATCGNSLQGGRAGTTRVPAQRTHSSGPPLT